MILVAYRHGLRAAELVELREITEKVLPNLTAEYLKDMDISIVGHHRKLLDAIAVCTSAQTPKHRRRHPGRHRQRRLLPLRRQKPPAGVGTLR